MFGAGRHQQFQGKENASSLAFLVVKDPSKVQEYRSEQCCCLDHVAMGIPSILSQESCSCQQAAKRASSLVDVESAQPATKAETTKVNKHATVILGHERQGAPDTSSKSSR